MSNPSVECNNTATNKRMLMLAALCVVAGFSGFYFFFSHPLWYLRSIALLSGLAAGIVVALFSASGRVFIGFAKEAWREIRKVVWPTRKETRRMTLVVFGFVLVMAIYLWIGDKLIEWMVFSLILGWK
jgi:preprotein translocase subunit SecE